jgi:5-methylcytosine-specific restriction endonuclease McrA
MKEYRKKNVKGVKASIKQWKTLHPERIREYSKRQRERNHEKAMQASKAWRQCNWGKDYATQCRRRARILAAPINDFTDAQWTQLKRNFNQRCAYCRKKRRLTRDHVIPLSKGGSHTVSNIVPACQSCNSSKGTKARPAA